MENKKNKRDLFQEARTLYHQNDLRGLRRCIREIVQLGRFNSLEKREVSNYYNILGKGDLALRILGRIRSANELKTASQMELLLQAELASKLIFHSANYTAMGLINSLALVIKPNLKFGSLLDKFPYYQGMILTYLFHSARAEEVLIDAIEFYSKQPERPEHKFCYLLLLKSLIDQSKFEEALIVSERARNFIHRDEIKFRLYLDAAEAEALTNLGEWNKAIPMLQQCLEIEQKSGNTPAMAQFHRQLGEIACCLSNELLGFEHLKKAHQILASIPHVPAFHWFPLLYAQENGAGFKNTLKHKIFLRLFPVYSPYIRLVEGKSIEVAIPKHVASQFIKSNSDAWVIHGGRILGIKASQFWQRRVGREDTVIDIVSGRWKKKGTYTYTILSQLQSNCIRALIGSGHQGVKNFHLIDYVYRQNFSDLDSAQARIDQLISQLRRMGFSIECHNTRYFFTPPANWYFLVPKLNSMANWWRLYQDVKFFERRDLESDFGLQKTRAIELVKLAIEQNKVKELVPGRYALV